MKLRQFRRQMGFTLIEIIIVLAIIGAGIGIALYYQSRASVSQQAKDVTAAVANMASKIRTYYSSAGSYTGLDAAAVNSMNLVAQPLTFSGGALYDPWGNAMTVTGMTGTFAITVGGATSALDKEACAQIASALGSGADVVYIGAASAANGRASGGSNYKSSSGVTSVSLLTTGCTAASPVVALQFH